MTSNEQANFYLCQPTETRTDGNFYSENSNKTFLAYDEAHKWIVKTTLLADVTPLRNRSLPRLNKRCNLCPDWAFTRHSTTFSHHNLPPLSISFLLISSRLSISHALSLCLTTREHAKTRESAFLHLSPDYNCLNSAICSRVFRFGKKWQQ